MRLKQSKAHLLSSFSFNLDTVGGGQYEVGGMCETKRKRWRLKSKEDREKYKSPHSPPPLPSFYPPPPPFSFQLFLTWPLLSLILSSKTTSFTCKTQNWNIVFFFIYYFVLFYFWFCGKISSISLISYVSV